MRSLARTDLDGGSAAWLVTRGTMLFSKGRTKLEWSSSRGDCSSHETMEQQSRELLNDGEAACLLQPASRGGGIVFEHDGVLHRHGDYFDEVAGSTTAARKSGIQSAAFGTRRRGCPL
ncbi:hypothetical protein M6B38_240590 [Iris pallida]|uniref:Uncharacterized protein n=1 Tax=Iris pallida TaxID=29817 RepID=A0AAX6DKE7_IRIPA|nr:hypothetical protein M6B38_240590 [Iris pallida]